MPRAYSTDLRERVVASVAGGAGPAGRRPPGLGERRLGGEVVATRRTLETTWKRIGSLLDPFTPTECANYLQNAGYPSK